MKSLLKALLVKGLVQFGMSTGLKAKSPRYLLLKISAGLLFLVAGLFVLIALHQWLLLSLSPPAVNLIFALGFAVSAGLVLLTVSIKRKQQQSKSPIDAPLRTLEEFGSRAQVQAKQLGDQAQAMVRHHSGKVLLGVAIVSLIIGRRSARK